MRVIDKTLTPYQRRLLAMLAGGRNLVLAGGKWHITSKTTGMTSPVRKGTVIKLAEKGYLVPVTGMMISKAGYDANEWMTLT